MENARRLPRVRFAPAPDRRRAFLLWWRALSGAPQDVPLGLCAYPSVAPDDLLACDAIFDPPDGSPEWGFPNYLLAYNPAHRWYYYSDMTPDEARSERTMRCTPADSATPR